MPWLHGLTRNHAQLLDHDPDPALRPILLPLGLEHSMHFAAERIQAGHRWNVLNLDPSRQILHATHRTRVWRFIDDVIIHFHAADGATLVTASSRSRVGKGDFGQNRRNLRMLTALLKP